MIDKGAIEDRIANLFDEGLIKQTGYNIPPNSPQYNLAQADNAKKHSYHLCDIGYVCESAPGWKGKAFGEIVFSMEYPCPFEYPLDERAIVNNFEEVIREMWREGDLRANLISCKEFGIGVAIDEESRMIYVKLRFAGQRQKNTSYRSLESSLLRSGGLL